MSSGTTTTVIATFQIPSDMFVGTDGNHTTMPPGGNANLSFPLISAAELAANPALVGGREQDMISLMAVIAISNQAFGTALSGVTLTVTAVAN